MKVAIIGAGASGLLASIIASDWCDVDVYEKNNTAGKKLILTGSGKCNIGNIDNDIKHYHSSNMEALEKIITEEKVKDVRKLLEDFGIVLKNKNGYLYPYSEKSSSVKSGLLANARVRGVNFYYDVFVDNIIKNKDKFIINGKTYGKVIITTGGKSYEKTGSDGYGYKLAKSFNHNIIKTYPSLVGLKTNTGYEKDLFGVRTTVDLSLYVDGSLVKKESGELQFTKDGLSGICIFNLSRDVKRYLEEEKCVEIGINFIPWYKSDKIFNKNFELSSVLDGFLDYKLSNVLLDIAKVKRDKHYDELSDVEKERLIDVLTNYKVKVVDTNSFDSSQVTSGGVDLSEVNPDTLESKLVSGLYFAGEILDIDGDCGGYNLTIAFVTALIAGGFYDKN